MNSNNITLETDTSVCIAPHLFDFAFCMRRSKEKPENDKDFNYFIGSLAMLAANENWGIATNKKKHPILHNYIHYTFQKLSEDYNSSKSGYDKDKLFCLRGDFACFNTGLFTERYEGIYCLLEKNNVRDKQPWFLVGFVKESDNSLNVFPKLPERAQYFSDPRDLIFDYRLQIRPNKDHILGDEENVKRLPPNLSVDMLHRLFDGAVQQAEKQVSANFKMAVPQFYKGSVQLLIPLSLNSDKPQLALAIQRDGEVYQARTCLTLNMAYNNARLIVRPDANWLDPSEM